MKPEVPSPQISPEHNPTQYTPNIEYAPDIASPESGIEKGAEKFEQRSELSAVVPDVGLTTALPTPVTQDISAVNDTSLGDSPLIANDDDLIEKEWVDKAKKIVAETRDDPYRREEAVSGLKADYLKKRYGRELGATE